MVGGTAFSSGCTFLFGESVQGLRHYNLCSFVQITHIFTIYTFTREFCLIRKYRIWSHFWDVNLFSLKKKKENCFLKITWNVECLLQMFKIKCVLIFRNIRRFLVMYMYCSHLSCASIRFVYHWVLIGIVHRHGLSMSSDWRCDRSDSAQNKYNSLTYTLTHAYIFTRTQKHGRNIA